MFPLDVATFQELFVQILNVSLMLSVGLEVAPERIRASFRRAGLLTAIIVFNFGVIPALAWSQVALLGVPASVATGLLLTAICPGGGTGTLLTRMANGSLELSIVLLGVFTALAVVLVPLLTMVDPTAFGDGQLSLAPVLKTLVVFQFAPLMVGFLVRARSAIWAERLDRLARPLSNAVFALLVVGLLAAKGHLVPTVGMRGIAAMAAVIIATLAGPALLRVPWHERAALSLTTGVRNLALSLLLATTLFTDAVTIAVLTYGLLMYLLSIPWVLFLRRRTAH